MNITIGTRGSKLALWQAHYVAQRLQHQGVETEIIIIRTQGDKKQEVSIAEIGTRGVFTQEIEEQLLQGTINIAVHSAKDLRSDLPDDFEIIAFSEREQVNDVLLSHQPIDIYSQHPYVIGTSSVRRTAMLRYRYPHLKTVEMRGNLQTRVAKLEAGHCDALLLAYAGVHRMGYESMIAHTFSTEEMIPAVGQGSVAVEALRSLDKEKKAVVYQAVNHAETEFRLRAERAYLKTLRGGCSVPVFALAQLEGHQLRLRGGIVSPEGTRLILDRIAGSREEAEVLGETLAHRVLAEGGEEILATIRS